jgi:predicted nucleic acid-binding protein
VLTDIVIDTNVFVHAHNKAEPRHESAKKLGLRLLEDDVPTMLCVDSGFSLDEARNQSRIGHEYIKHCVPGMLGHHVIQTLASTKRIKQVRPTPDMASRKCVRKIVADKDDRVFLLVALASDDRTLVSHDKRAFPKRAKTACKNLLSIVIWDAKEALGSL